MENEVEEENKSKKHKMIALTPDWLDLPNPIATNIILGHLEIDDYIRFSAVCKKWQLTQREHRIRYSPFLSPSPLPFPCLTWNYHSIEDDKNRSICLYLPDKQKSYDIPVPCASAHVYIMHCNLGWLLLLNIDDLIDRWMSIFNPVTGEQIKLPPFLDTMLEFWGAYMSSSPLDLACTILMFTAFDDGCKLYFCRLNDNNGWKTIDYFEEAVHKIAFSNNRFYFLSLCRRRIYSVDEFLSEPVAKMNEMDLSEFSEDLDWSSFHLVDLLGEVVMVVIEKGTSVRCYYDTMKEIHVFKADFSTDKWVRMESLGDHVLFISLDSTFSFAAIDVIGCKKNTIYSTADFNGYGVAWRAFNLSSRDWIDGPPMSHPLSKDRDSYGGRQWSWLFPTF